MAERSLDSSRLHERLARQIAVEIVSGKLNQDEVVASAEILATDHGVSRTVARVTLQALSAAGLITVRHGKRTTVAPVHEWRFLDDLVQDAVAEGRVGGKFATDLLETRIALELAAVRWCTERADDDQVSEIVRVAEHQVVLSRQTPPPLNDIAAADLRFHSLLALGTGNHMVAQLVTNLRRQLIPTWAMERLSMSEHKRGADEHLAVAHAIAKRDSDLAAQELRVHFQRTGESTLKRSLPETDHVEIDHRAYPAHQRDLWTSPVMVKGRSEG